ncbi:MAG: peptidoglycan-binding domain-containing protein, partial [Limisphaerales bacterium]
MKTHSKIFRAAIGFATSFLMLQQATPVRAADACDRQELAEKIRDNSRIYLATTHTSGVIDSANARQTIVDTANGNQAKRSAYGTAPGGSVWLDPRMLDCMDKLEGVYGYSYSVSETSGGSHSSGSYHYDGTAFDVYIINGVGVSSSNPYWSTFNQRCRDMGSIESLGPGCPGHDT